jgi:hypothetical protein
MDGQQTEHLDSCCLTRVRQGLFSMNEVVQRRSRSSLRGSEGQRMITCQRRTLDATSDLALLGPAVISPAVATNHGAYRAGRLIILTSFVFDLVVNQSGLVDTLVGT